MSKTGNKLLLANRKLIAKELGITVSGVSRILSGNRTPNLHRFYQLAQFFGVTMDTLYKQLYDSQPDTSGADD